ncbi:MAG: flavodoxin domain-containing protein [Candidatus Heimdallarchaeota archaeon]|nr:flavodoxin domain-containing protein [Candidatus Heimdallarchaeota archaeon]
MKILVTYYTQTGQTEKVAKAIFKAVKEKYEVQLVKLKDIEKLKLDDYNLIFAGTPCHNSDLAKPFQKFLKNLPLQSKLKLAIFYTHACLPPETNEKSKKLFDEWVGKCEVTFTHLTKEKNIAFQGFFRCMGAASPMIEKFIHRQIITDKDEWEEYLPDLRTRPNAIDLENAGKFALKILTQIERN